MKEGVPSPGQLVQNMTYLMDLHGVPFEFLPVAIEVVAPTGTSLCRPTFCFEMHQN